MDNLPGEEVRGGAPVPKVCSKRVQAVQPTRLAC